MLGRGRESSMKVNIGIVALFKFSYHSFIPPFSLDFIEHKLV